MDALCPNTPPQRHPHQRARHGLLFPIDVAHPCTFETLRSRHPFQGYRDVCAMWYLSVRSNVPPLSFRPTKLKSYFTKFGGTWGMQTPRNVVLSGNIFFFRDKLMAPRTTPSRITTSGSLVFAIPRVVCRVL